MNFLESIIAGLGGTMTTPEWLGMFHLISFGLMVVVGILIVVFLRNTTEKQNRIILIVYAVTCILLEVYKQLIYSYNPSTGEWKYQWYAFPFQLCSTPMYVAFVAAFLKKGAVRDSMFSYLATFGMLAGFAVMVVTGDVFISTIGINIQTMYHHATQVLIGVYLIASGRVKLDLKTPLRALPVFLVLLAVALTLNMVIPQFVNGQTFNMFFVGPTFPTTLIGFSAVYPLVPHPVFVLIYVAVFTAGTYLISLSATGIKYLVTKNKNKKLTSKKVVVKS